MTQSVWIVKREILEKKELNSTMVFFIHEICLEHESPAVIYTHFKLAHTQASMLLPLS